jgi:hypothetical protein
MIVNPFALDCPPRIDLLWSLAEEENVAPQMFRAAHWLGHLSNQRGDVADAD